METKIFYESDLNDVANIIVSGGIIAVPTDTVYGLAGNGLDYDVIDKIYTLKGRSEVKPISLFVKSIKDVELLCDDVSEQAYILVDKFWPGPLTMILKSKNIIPDILTAGSNTVGVRCPDNSLILNLLKIVEFPLTGTSANLSGYPDSKKPEDVIKYFDHKIDGIIDGGTYGKGIPSTVVNMTGKEFKIIREGSISEREIRDALKR